MSHSIVDQLVASAVARILKIGLVISLACLCIGLFLKIISPDNTVGDRFMMGGLMVLVLTPPVKSLVLGVIYLRERMWWVGASAIAVFIIVMGVWYWK